MPEIIKHEPPPPAPSYDIKGLTFDEMHTIMEALKWSSGGNWEKGNGYYFTAPSRFGTLYNTLSSKGWNHESVYY